MKWTDNRQAVGWGGWAGNRSWWFLLWLNGTKGEVTDEYSGSLAGADS